MYIKGKSEESFSTKLIAGVSAFALAIVISADAAARPPRGGGPNSEEREKFHAVVQACAEEKGITIDPESGQRPTDEQRAVIDACLKEKGITPPQHGPRGPRPPAPEEESE